MIHIPIEERYNKNRGMFHSGAFAIAAGVAGVGAAATSGIMGAQAASRAARAQGAAAKKYQKQQKKISQNLQQQLAQVDTNIQAPQYNVGAMIGDAERMTAYNLAQLEKALPGAQAARVGSQQALQQQQQRVEGIGKILDEYASGRLPKELADEITRNVAERYGAGLAPGVQGFYGQQAAFQGARGLGLGALGLQQYAIGAMPGVTSQLGAIANTQQNWQQVAGSFIANPIAAGQLQLGYGEAGMRAQEAQARLKLAGIEMQNLQNQRAAQGIYQSSQDAIEATLAGRQAIASGVQGVGSAIQGGLSGVSGAYGQQQTARLYDARTQAMGGRSIFPT